jgi:hypothetical protein
MFIGVIASIVTRQHLRFYDVERPRELEPLLADLTASGALIVAARCDVRERTAEIVYEVVDIGKFRRAFQATPSAHWLK